MRGRQPYGAVAEAPILEQLLPGPCSLKGPTTAMIPPPIGERPAAPEITAKG